MIGAWTRRLFGATRGWNRRLLCWGVFAEYGFCCVYALVANVPVALAAAVIGPQTPFVFGVIGWYFKVKRDERVAAPAPAPTPTTAT